jgi:probable F420-dependent oxidoreductase
VRTNDLEDQVMADGLDFGLYGLLRGNGTDPETLTRRAFRAEQAGFESLWVGDHLALPTEEGGRQPRLEVVVAVSYLAAVTTRVRLGFGVLVLPQRQPVLLAKQLSSIDVLSRGRVAVGIGVGYVEPELRALGVPMAERGARTDEYLAAMKTLWTEPDPSFDGRFVSFAGIQQQPPPIQRPHPPITVGGSSDAALRRAATAANGWYGVYLSVEETAATLIRLRKIITEVDRPAELGGLEITITPPGRIDRSTARRYADLGVRRLVLQPGSEDGEDLDELIDTTGATMINSP